MSWLRMGLLALLIEALAVLTLVLVVAFVGPSDPAEAQAYAEEVGTWLGPVAGFVLCLGGGWLVARRRSTGHVARGALLGSMVAAIDVAILAAGGAGFQLLFLVSNAGRIVAGSLGGLLAGLRKGDVDADVRA